MFSEQRELAAFFGFVDSVCWATKIDSSDQRAMANLVPESGSFYENVRTLH